MDNENKNGINKIILIILIVILVGGAFFGGMYYQEKQSAKTEEKETKNEEPKKENEKKEEEPQPEEPEKRKTVQGIDYTLLYDSTSFELTGREGNCEVNYDKEFTGSKTITEGKIVNAKIMEGFRCGGSETAVLILDTGAIYLASFDCDGNLVYEREQWLKEYKVKDVIEAELCMSCTINTACDLNAKVILQDGTEKIVKIDIQN